MDETFLAQEYQVLEELGSGSFGVVYKGIERRTGELVAIKHIDLESSEDDIQDIQQEISLLSTCQSPFVTQYKASFLRGHKLWIVMEYLGGGSCLDLLKPGPFTEEYISIICRELLLGLAYLHAESKIHRDIKAANVLLANNGKVKLADFGVAAQLSNIKSQRNTFVGTPFWMAPEVIQQAGYDFKADIWSLGITAIELARGEPPNANLHPMKALFMIPKASAPRLDGPHFSKDLRSFVTVCLMKDPEKRPTAKELLQHRFIRNAGPVQELQDLIDRKRQWDENALSYNSRKFYEETMRCPNQSKVDETWVFDTIKGTATIKDLPKPDETVASPVSPLDFSKAEQIEIPQVGAISPPLCPQTVRQAPIFDIENITHTENQVAKITPNVRLPLSSSRDSGNAGATVRKVPRPAQPHNVVSQPTEAMPSPTVNVEMIKSTEEATRGKLIFSRAIEPAIREVSAATASIGKQEMFSRLAQAWKTMTDVDAEGTTLLVEIILQKLQSDPALSHCLPPSANGTMQKPKLMLASNNPHLKSHRRRRTSSFQLTRSISNQDSARFPGQTIPGMDHTKQLADVLYTKWLDNMRLRWPSSS